jgi:hypothetical protein
MIETLVITAPVAFAIGATVQTPVIVRAQTITARLSRAGVILAKDKRLPIAFRIVLGVACLPIPGPLDNAVQVLSLVILLTRYRQATSEAWRAAI